MRFAPPPPGRWNHNSEYHPLALRHAAQARSALDVGCGEGLLTRRLVRSGAAGVVGVDLDEGQVAAARHAAAGDPDLRYLQGDVLDLPQDEQFDLVTCYATLHHLDLHAGLTRLRELTAPGGHLVVVGLAATRSPVDLAFDVASVPAHAWVARSRGVWEHGAPVADASDSYGAVRRTARALLPGVRFRHRLYFRYSLEWTAPISG